jgi:hypothetical protein
MGTGMFAPPAPPRPALAPARPAPSPDRLQAHNANEPSIVQQISPAFIRAYFVSRFRSTWWFIIVRKMQ